MANPFMNDKKYKKTVINTLIFIVFFLPIIIFLYLALFNFTFSAGQIGALFYLFCMGLTFLPIVNLLEL